MMKMKVARIDPVNYCSEDNIICLNMVLFPNPSYCGEAKILCTFVLFMKSFSHHT